VFHPATLHGILQGRLELFDLIFCVRVQWFRTPMLFSGECLNGVKTGVWWNLLVLRAEADALLALFSEFSGSCHDELCRESNGRLGLLAIAEGQ